MLCLQCHNYLDIKRSEQAGARCQKRNFCFGVPRQLSRQNKMLVLYISAKRGYLSVLYEPLDISTICIISSSHYVYISFMSGGGGGDGGSVTAEYC